MNAILNYLVEANVALCVLLLLYVIVFRQETDFRMKRTFLFLAVAVSVVVPFFHLEAPAGFVPSLQDAIPTSWLPEVVITAEGHKAGRLVSAPDVWLLIKIAYTAGVVLSLSLFLIRLAALLKLFLRLEPQRMGTFLLFESNESKSSFSFFRYIYVGQADLLSEDEKAMIVRHEQIHAQQLHSFDILLMNVIGVFFWFNPIIPLYKKAFIQLHEFEADARAVGNPEVDNYCSLLAKVALLSADFKLANHFSNSLTLKRIEMMRTFKSSIKRWKLTAFTAALAVVFVAIACQDQVATEVAEIARNSSNALLAPDVVQARFDEVKKANPSSSYVLVELNEAAEQRLQQMEAKYGLPKSIELFTPDAGEYKNSAMHAAPNERISVHQSDEWKRAAGEARTFAIIEYNEATAQMASGAAGEDEVYTVVEKPAEFPGGIPELKNFLASSLVYPSEARQQGIEGAVFISFIVEKDGTISDVQVVKGLSAECDAEALRVVSSLPKWIPGKQSGKIVRSRFVLPIKYALG